MVSECVCVRERDRDGVFDTIAGLLLCLFRERFRTRGHYSAVTSLVKGAYATLHTYTRK